LHCIKPLLLLWSYPAGQSLDFNGQKNRYLLANHIWGDGDLLPTDQVGAALAKAELNWASVGILQRPGVIAEQATVAFTASEADVLLDLLLGQAVPCLLANLA
jgi:hypothetical protein